MARTRGKVDVGQALPTRALVASAVRYRGGKAPLIFNTTEDWQHEAYRQFEICGEAQFAAKFLAHAVGRASLTISKDSADGPLPVAEGPAVDELNRLYFGPHGQAEMLEEIAIHLAIAGECYLVGRTISADEVDHSGADDGEIWEVISIKEMHIKGQRWSIDYGDGNVIDLDDDDYIIRIWLPRPGKRAFAHSPFRSLLPTLQEIEWLTRHIFAQTSSRLAGAGLLVLPNNMTFPAPPGGARADGNEADQFLETLADAMMKPISDPSSPSALVPITITAPPEAISDIKHITFWSELDSESKELRAEAIRRFALGMELPMEQILGMSGSEGTGGGRSAGLCVDTETEALTQRGWVRHDQIEVGDLALSLNHSTGQSEWKPVTAVRQFQVEDCRMLRMEGVAHSSLSTANHRWPVLRERQSGGVVRVAREWVESSALTCAHRIPTSAPSADLPTEAKYSDDFVELAAWFWTEGRMPPTGQRNNRTCCIVQSHTRNPEKVDRIRACLDRLSPEGWGSEHVVQPEYGGACTSFHLRKHIVEALRGVGGKRLNREFIRSLTRAQLELFIDVSSQGDGWHRNQGRLDIWQRDASALEAYELALVLSGRTVTRTECSDGTCVSDWRGKSTARPIKAAQGGAIVEWEDYTGTVWCPEVADNHSWFARRNGKTYFTGNSHWGAWQVEESTIKMHVEPILNSVCNALTMMFLRPLTDGTEDADAYVTYDTSALRLRPDKSKEAVELYDRGDLKLSRMLEENGFSASDVPDDEEFKTWLLRKIASGSATPEQVQAALTLLGVELPVAEAEQGEPREARPAPALDRPERPRTPAETERRRSERRYDTDAALLSASEGLVLRALELCGKRVMNDRKRGKERPTEYVPHEVHCSLQVNGQGPELLKGAFELAHPMLNGIADPEVVVPQLRAYCLELFERRQAHSRDALAEWLGGHDG